MKIILITALSCLFTFSVHAVNYSANQGNPGMSDSSQLNSSQLLSVYYDIKNALVNNDAKTASAKASAFINIAEKINIKAMPKPQQDVFSAFRDNLMPDAKHIAEVRDTGSQRKYFATFSVSMWGLVKSGKLYNEPVYQLYCPMKKTFWLSNESTIKNPYFGKQMLSCGKVTATLK